MRQMINPRDMYYLAHKSGKSVEFITKFYLEEIVSPKGLPGYITKEGVLIKKPIEDIVFEERWKNDQILLTAFLQGWDKEGTELVKKYLYFGYAMDVPFWTQYNKRMPELIRILRKASSFLKEE